MTNIQFPKSHACAVLTINLAAIANNYRLLQNQIGSAECGAVVKANGYGLGAEQVGTCLYDQGCRNFFVAHLQEGVHLRGTLQDAQIHILGGLTPGAEAVYLDNKLIPVLGSLGEIAAWKKHTKKAPFPCDIHVDTGMLRLGLPPNELNQIADDPGLLDGLQIKNVMSHLASADEADNPQNQNQLAAFRTARQIIPHGKASFANSSGIFLGASYHYDLTRPGVALYGVNPTPGSANPMNSVVTLAARIVQIRDARAGETVGYGAAHTVEKNARIATLSVGYADGYLRSLSGNAFGYIDDFKVPLVGRVSMDLITFDVSSVPSELCHVGTWIELIGPRHSVDELAREAGTIGYEVLTNLGSRYHRIYEN